MSKKLNGELTCGRREELEMSGYCWGRDVKPDAENPTIYRYAGWTDKEAEAFRKGVFEGLDYSVALGEYLPEWAEALKQKYAKQNKE